MNDILFIYPNDDVYLPEGFHFSHNVCTRLYDDLVWILKDATIQRKFKVRIDFDLSNERPDSENVDIIEWLLEKGYKKEVDEIISKNLMSGLISDSCHFIYQALNSAKKIKLTVAISLLRKPFLENLLIIEQLLVDESDFLRRFESEANKFDPGKVKTERKKELIENCIDSIRPNSFLSSDFINELRWDKNNPNSLYAYSNIATHLVTTRNPSYKTEKNNLNLIFSGEHEWLSQLDYFYYFLPFILYYSTEVVDTYLLKNKMITKKKGIERKFLRIIGQMLLHEQHDERSEKGKTGLTSLSRKLKVKCKKCNKTNQLYKSDLFNLVNDDYVLCKFCLYDLLRETESLNQMMKKFVEF